MLFGEPELFAAECAVTSRGEFSYCEFGLWVNSQYLGSRGDEMTLGVLIHSSNVFLRYRGKRQFQGSGKLDKYSLISAIREACFPSNPLLIEASVEARYRQKHLLHELSDDLLATQYFIALVDEPSSQRLVWTKEFCDEVFEMSLPGEFVDRAIEQLVLANK